MGKLYDCTDEKSRVLAIGAARVALSKGELIVLPTDTVYGVGCDAFNPDAVTRLLTAKGRDRMTPPPVLIPGLPTLDALAEEVPDQVRTLVERFWPGGLTVIVPARESLSWDLGETHGTVALRMPDNRIALDLLGEFGPMAVSSANLTGRPAATTAQQAEESLGELVEVVLDGGEVGGEVPTGASNGSTIVDATPLLVGKELKIVRHGVITDEAIREALA